MNDYTPEHEAGSPSYDCLDCAHDDGNGDCTLRPRPYMQASWATVNGPCRKWQKAEPVQNGLSKHETGARVMTPQRNTDPTRDEMLTHLRETFADELREYPEGFEFSSEAAVYWFGADYHVGQWSNLYSATSTSPYHPGIMENEPHEGTDREMYDELVNHFAE